MADRRSAHGSVTGAPLGDVSSVFLTEARLANDPAALAQLAPVVSGVSQMAQSTLLLRKRKEAREVDDALEFMKEEFQQRMDACEARSKELARKQHEMKDQVARFDKFIKENDSKRTRAELKSKSEHRQAETSEARRKQLAAQLEKDMREREGLERTRDTLLKYRQFLEAAVEASEGEYEEVGDVLNRHATLIDANRDLRTQVRAAEMETDELRQKIRALKLETQNLVLVQNSGIHALRQKLEVLQGEALRLDLDRQRGDRVANDRSRESGQIVLTVTNLYNRCRISLGDKLLPALREQDADVATYVHGLLKVIASRIIDLDYIVSSYHKEQSTSKGTNAATTGDGGGGPGGSTGANKAARAANAGSRLPPLSV